MVAPSKKTSFKWTKREEVLHEIHGKSGIVSVIGADIGLGAHMIKCLSDAGKTVYGFTQKKDFKFSLKPIFVCEVAGLDFPPHPILSDWLIVCTDPCIGFEEYTARIRNLCRHLYAKKYSGNLLFFSSTEICQPGENGVSEESTVAPRTEKGLNLATAENILNVMLYKPGNEVLPHILRLGDTEIDEACAKAITMMNLDFCPDMAII